MHDGDRLFILVMAFSFMIFTGWGLVQLENIASDTAAMREMMEAVLGEVE